MFSRTEWPFKYLAMGESCIIPKEDAQRAKRYVYVYASQSGKRMTCKTNKDGSVTVMRIPEKGTNGVLFTAEEMAILHQLFPNKIRLRAFGGIVAKPYTVRRTEDGGVLFEAKAV
jgi:hypothetical protein